MDPNQVGSCGPGVESIDVIDETHFKAKAKVGVGFIKAHFTIDMEMTDLGHAQPRHGQGPWPGAGLRRRRRSAQMDLRDGEAAGTTIMDWSADVNISGTLASVGARMIEGTAHKMIDQTFDCIKAKLEV